MEKEDLSELSKLLADERTVSILNALSEPTYVQKISKVTEIPIATCYRHVRRMEKKGLISTKRKEDALGGKKRAVYERIVDSYSSGMEDGRYFLELDGKKFEL